MKESINFRPKDAHNKFTEVDNPEELLRIQNSLTERIVEIKKEKDNYEGDDMYGIEQELEITSRDLHAVEQEIKRRADNN